MCRSAVDHDWPYNRTASYILLNNIFLNYESPIIYPGAFNTSMDQHSFQIITYPGVWIYSAVLSCHVHGVIICITIHYKMFYIDIYNDSKNYSIQAMSN